MSLPPAIHSLPTDAIQISTWLDPLLDQHGHDARSTYVEQFWLPILGPTTTLFLRHVAHRLEQNPDGFELPVAATASALGLGLAGGRNTPFLRAIARAAKFKLARHVGHDTLAVHPRIPPLTRVQLDRLPSHVRDTHQRWQEESRRHPDVEQLRRRARRLALSLIEIGESDEQVERQLHRWQFHPALAHDALRWAHERRHQPAPDTSPIEAEPRPRLIRSAGAPPLPA
ncbi:MAG: hypothetical protein IPG97_11835 [Microthrixaceae bacterium]|nr:hypothetical protein [Microthrixaceae bacterium]